MSKPLNMPPSLLISWNKAEVLDLDSHKLASGNAGSVSGQLVWFVLTGQYSSAPIETAAKRLQMESGELLHIEKLRPEGTLEGELLFAVEFQG